MTAWKLCTQMTLLLVSMAVHAEGGGAGRHGNHKDATSLIPPAIAAEHRDLHDKLREVIRSGGKTGRAADAVEKLLKPHFVKEEQYALPPLGQLSAIAAGQLPAESAVIIRMTDTLRAELPQMLAEHRQVVAALGQLRQAAEAEGNREGIQFAEALAAHAAQEEQVLYPAALLVGAYLKQAQR